MRDTNYLRGCPPGGWAHYNAEKMMEDREEERYQEDKKVDGLWITVRYTKRGPTSEGGSPMSYADAVRECKERNKEEQKMASNGLGEFCGKFKIEKYVNK